jgi:hypothetical protein
MWDRNSGLEAGPVYCGVKEEGSEVPGKGVGNERVVVPGVRARAELAFQGALMPTLLSARLRLCSSPPSLDIQVISGAKGGCGNPEGAVSGA